MKIADLLESLPEAERFRLLGRLEGMSYAMRIVRNRVADLGELHDQADTIHGRAMLHAQAGEARNIEAILRLMQVEIGSARREFGPLTFDEIEELMRIY